MCEAEGVRGACGICIGVCRLRRAPLCLSLDVDVAAGLIRGLGRRGELRRRSIRFGHGQYARCTRST